MDYAVVHNTQMKHFVNEQRRREVSTQASKDARLPRFDGAVGGILSSLHYSGSGNRFNAQSSLTSLGLTGVLPLYTGNRLSSQIKADRYAQQAAEADVRSIAKDLRVQVAAAYLQVLYNRGEAAIASQRLEVSQQLLCRARSLFDKGKRPESDVAEATAMVSRDMALMEATNGEVALSMIDLRQLLNLPDTTLFDISELPDTLAAIPLNQSDRSYLQQATHHPAVQSAGYIILQAEQGVKTARSGYYPQLSLIGELSTFWSNIDSKANLHAQIPLRILPEPYNRINIPVNYESDGKWHNYLHAFAGLQLTIPIFDAFRTKARIRTAKIGLEDARLAYDDARHRVEKEISQAWQATVTAYKRYQAEVKAEESGALSYRYALKRYEAGMSTFYDLNQSHQQWFDASENAMRMKFEYLIRKRILEIHSDTESHANSH